MRKVLFIYICLICLFGSTMTAEASYDTKPVAFIVIDRTGEVDNILFKDWEQQVRQGYHVPYYSIVDSKEPTRIAQELIAAKGEKTAQLDKKLLQQIATEAKVNVVTLMIIHKMTEVPLRGISWGNPWSDNDSLTRMYAFADMYVYKLDENKMLKKVLRSVVTDDAALITPAKTVIKYEMRSLVNTMENRPQL